MYYVVWKLFTCCDLSRCKHLKISNIVTNLCKSVADLGIICSYYVSIVATQQVQSKILTVISPHIKNVYFKYFLFTSNFFGPSLCCLLFSLLCNNFFLSFFIWINAALTSSEHCKLVSKNCNSLSNLEILEQINFCCAFSILLEGVVK